MDPELHAIVGAILMLLGWIAIIGIYEYLRRLIKERDEIIVKQHAVVQDLLNERLERPPEGHVRGRG